MKFNGLYLKNVETDRKYKIYQDGENKFIKTVDFMGVTSGQKFISLKFINMEYFVIE